MLQAFRVQRFRQHLTFLTVEVYFNQAYLKSLGKPGFVFYFSFQNPGKSGSAMVYQNFVARVNTKYWVPKCRTERNDLLLQVKSNKDLEDTGRWSKSGLGRSESNAELLYIYHP